MHFLLFISSTPVGLKWSSNGITIKGGPLELWVLALCIHACVCSVGVHVPIEYMYMCIWVLECVFIFL